MSQPRLKIKFNLPSSFIVFYFFFCDFDSRAPSPLQKHLRAVKPVHALQVKTTVEGRKEAVNAAMVTIVVIDDSPPRVVTTVTKRSLDSRIHMKRLRLRPSQRDLSLIGRLLRHDTIARRPRHGTIATDRRRDARHSMRRTGGVMIAKENLLLSLNANLVARGCVKVVFLLSLSFFSGVF